LHITDPHLFADSDSSLRGTNTLQSLQQVLRHVCSSDWPADIVAATGDLIQDDSFEAYERFCDQFGKLKLPVHCVPGNHDIRSRMHKVLQRPGFHYCENARLQNWLIVGLDSCMTGSAAGQISNQEMARLRRTLDEATEDHILICLHHPPLPVGSKWLDGVGLGNAQEFIDLIASFGAVRGAIFGHVHQSFDSSYNGVKIIGTPSTCRQFKVASDEFAVDDSPPAYRRISLLDEGTIETELIWVSD